MLFIIVLIVIILIVGLRILTAKKFSKIEKYDDFINTVSKVDAPLSELFKKGNGVLNNNKISAINKNIEEKILTATLNKKATDTNSEFYTNTKDKLRPDESKDLIRRIFDMENQIFTSSVNHDLLCKNLKYELIKLMEDSKPISMIERDYNIVSKK